MALQHPNLTASQQADSECSARMASEIGSLHVPRHARPDESFSCIKLTFSTTGMNWMMSKKMMMNTEGMTTIAPPV
jgi:hypothetical protein